MGFQFGQYGSRKKGNTGFNAGTSFYSSTPAVVSVDITYKGLAKTFDFTLRSATDAPTIVAHRIDTSNWNIYSEGLTISDLNSGNYQPLNYSDESDPENFVQAGDNMGHEFSITVLMFISGKGKTYIVTDPAAVNFDLYYSDTKNPTPVKVASNKYAVTASSFFGYKFKEVDYTVKGTGLQAGNKAYADIKLTSLNGVTNNAFKDVFIRRFTVGVTTGSPYMIEIVAPDTSPAGNNKSFDIYVKTFSNGTEVINQAVEATFYTKYADSDTVYNTYTPHTYYSGISNKWTHEYDATSMDFYYSIKWNGQTAVKKIKVR